MGEPWSNAAVAFDAWSIHARQFVILIQNAKPRLSKGFAQLAWARIEDFVSPTQTSLTEMHSKLPTCRKDLKLFEVLDGLISAKSHVCASSSINGNPGSALAASALLGATHLPMQTPAWPFDTIDL
mmetsp:Transcript_15524/g.33677  ORF Transcript_15524/g.33677 Transcript_15524/m.33677 type:complete len:126 (-) Transcript_15524:262-639(-)